MTLALIIVVKELTRGLPPKRPRKRLRHVKMEKGSAKLVAKPERPSQDAGPHGNLQLTFFMNNAASTSTRLDARI